MFKKILTFVGLGFVLVVGGLLVIQLIPYGRNHTNPPVVSEPQWPDTQTRALAQRACFDCHSNETTWPWYSNVAPISWMTQHNVSEGRSKLNFSEWNNGGHGEGAHEMVEALQEGKMPPFDYLIMHPEARLSDAERQQLIQGLSQLR
ncbi:MAG: hypothetical protein Fur0018_23280 [Anaerolineales bacterium]